MKVFIIILLISSIAFCQSVDNIIQGPVFDVAPTLIGGFDSLYVHLNWPESAMQLDIEGRIVILAYLDSLGNLDSTKVLKSLGFGFDEEALLAVKQCKFTPGYAHQLMTPNNTNNKIYRLKPIKSQMLIPIRFYRK